MLEPVLVYFGLAVFSIGCLITLGALHPELIVRQVDFQAVNGSSRYFYKASFRSDYYQEN